MIKEDLHKVASSLLGPVIRCGLDIFRPHGLHNEVDD